MKKNLICALALLAILASCKKNEPKFVAKPIVKTEAPVPKPAPAQKPKPVPKPVPEPKFFTVAGCFEVEDNAKKLQSELINQGYKSKIVKFYKYSMVTFNGYQTREEAQAEVNTMVNKDEDSLVWIYSVK